MCLIILIFVSVNLCDSVIIRIKPVHILSYYKNHTSTSSPSSSQISASSVILADTSPATTKKLSIHTRKTISPSSSQISASSVVLADTSPATTKKLSIHTRKKTSSPSLSQSSASSVVPADTSPATTKKLSIHTRKTISPSSSQISASSVVVAVTSPAISKKLSTYTKKGLPLSPVSNFSTQTLPFITTDSIADTDYPKESPESSKTKFDIIPSTEATPYIMTADTDHPKESPESPKIKFDVTPANGLVNSTTLKKTTASLAPIIPGKKLTDHASLFQISPHTRLFYWFFGSRSSLTDPLVVWLQGQPNASSVYGAFDETGPYLINPKTLNLAVRQYSWSNSFNVLYLDPYPGCGFSYSDNPLEYSVSYKQVAKSILKALKQFFTLYPQLATNSMYLAAQSIGAKYAITVAHAILETVHQYRMNLKGVLLGGAVVDEYQLANYDYRLFTFGLVDLKTMNEMTEPQDYMAALIRAAAYSRAVEFWHQQIFKFFTSAGYQSPYDVRLANAFWDSRVANYLNQANVKKDLKIGALKFQPAAKAYITSETLRPLQILIRELLSNIKVLFYHGQFDMFAPITHSTEFLNKFSWPGNKDFYASKRENWYIGKRLAGYWSKNENLTLLLIRNAGHMVGVTQPESMLRMLMDFTNDKFKYSYESHSQNLNPTLPEDSITEESP